MELKFEYKIEKEFDNFRRSFASLNHSEPSPREQEFFSSYRELTPENAQAFVSAYLAKHSIAIQEKLEAIQQAWSRVNDQFFDRSDRIWGAKFPIDSLHIYLTIHDRCSTSFLKNEFFVHLHLPSTNKTIMHELWHWYFYYHGGTQILERNGRKVFNDIKESLTVLLNEEFVDLLDGVIDRGYPQHQELRAFILQHYQETKNIQQTIDRALKIL